MIVSVTTLGSSSGDAAGAAAGVVSYLEGHTTQRPGVSPGQVPDLPRGEGLKAGVVAYYADSVEGPGTWVGRGTTTVRPSRSPIRARTTARHIGNALAIATPLVARWDPLHQMDELWDRSLMATPSSSLRHCSRSPCSRAWIAWIVVG